MNAKDKMFYLLTGIAMGILFVIGLMLGTGIMRFV